jgi:hypothetical protein
MFRVKPGDEYGRNDNPKLGYCVVDVFSDDLRVNIYRSYGQTLEMGAELVEKRHVQPSHTMVAFMSPLGVHLRHSLTETIDLPYMGPIDEFVRKRTRNDYPVLGLWETGIKTARLPLSDLRDEYTKKRLYELHSAGHCFGFFNVDLPDRDFIDENRGVIDFVEVILPWEKAEDKLPEISGLRGYTGLPVYVANIESSVHRERKGPKFSHYISHGFHINDTKQLEEILPEKGAIDGFVFQINQMNSPLISVKKISEYSNRNGFKAIANVRLGSEDPAEYFADDDYVAGKAAEATIAAYAYPNVQVFLDTFVDHDRGYFPRVGLYDRRINPRKGAYVVRNLNAAVQCYGSEISVTDVQHDFRGISFRAGNVSYQLHTDGKGMAPSRGSKLVDLVTGEIDPEMTGAWCLEIIED